MALRKKGTPAKISLLTESELTTLRSLVSKALKAGYEPSDVFPESKPNKGKK
jgi:hypothetical protein